MMMEGFKRSEIKTSGANIVTVQGGKGPPVLLLHGNPFTHLSWHDVAPVLARDFTVVCTDLRGGVLRNSNYRGRVFEPAVKKCQKADETFLAITRRDYIVRHYELEGPAYELLRDIIAGQSMGEAVRHAGERGGVDVDQLVGKIRDWFRDWTAEGFFKTIGI